MLVVAAALAGYYLWHWRSVAEFCSSLDSCAYLFCDFLRVYYPMAQAVLEAKRPVFGYFYSAFFALLLYPFGLVPLRVALVSWGVLQLACVALAVAVPFRNLLPKTPGRILALFALTCASVPVLHNFAWGQISLFLVVLVLGSFAAAASGVSILAGILLALAVAIKFYPALFLVYFVFRRDVRALATLAVALPLFWAVVPSAALGPREFVAFEVAARDAVRTATWVATNVNSQYLVHVGLRYTDWLFPSLPNTMVAVVLKVTGLAVGASSVVPCWLLRKQDTGEAAALSFAALSLAQPFLLPTSWPHYFCHLAFCQILLFWSMRRLPPGVRGKLLLASVILSIALSSAFVFNLFPHWKSYSFYGTLFVANALLIAPLWARVLGMRERT